jgi:DHA2 family multidrug resistance protein
MAAEEPLIVLRVIQSFCSGIISVLMFTAVMATLPPGTTRYIGLAGFAFASTAPTALNSSAGAFVTENWGWEGLYYFDLGWSVTFLLLAWRFLRPTPRAMSLSQVDWLGYVILAVGLAALILFMKQGDRFFWLDNPAIRLAGLLAAIAIPLGLMLFLVRRRPLLDLGLMLTPTFGWAIAIATFYRFGLVMTAFVVPQALTRLQGFRIEQIADANIWMFWAQCAGFPLAWLWASRGDARQPLSLGLALFAAGAFVCSYLTPAMAGGRLPSGIDFGGSRARPVPGTDPVLRDARSEAGARDHRGGVVQSQPDCRTNPRHREHPRVDQISRGFPFRRAGGKRQQRQFWHGRAF